MKNKVTLVKQENKWFPVLEDGKTIDMRSSGHESKAAAKRSYSDRDEALGQKTQLIFE